MQKQIFPLEDKYEMSDEGFIAFNKEHSYPIKLIRETEMFSDGTICHSFIVEANVPDGEFLQDDLIHFFIRRY